MTPRRSHPERWVFEEERHAYGDWGYFTSVLQQSTRNAFIQRAREFFTHGAGPVWGASPFTV
jgi:hypothetical protein